MNNYFELRNYKTSVKTKEIISNLPTFCSYFFIGIESRTSELTRLNYAGDLKTFFWYLSTNLHVEPKYITLDDLNKVTSLDVEKYISSLSYYMRYGKLYKNNEKAKARKLSSLRSLFTYLYKKDMIKENVTTKVASAKLHDKEIIRLETDEVSKLLNQSERATNMSTHQENYCNKNTNLRDSAIITLFLGTGIRVSELVGLNVDDFNYTENAFVITRKGGNRVTLYFSEEVENALKNNLIWRENLKELPAEEKAMFISLQRKRITVRAIENIIKKHSQAAVPLKHITPHKLRSTYGTNLYRETKDIYIVADVLGHKDVNTTRKHYAAISEDIRKSVVDKVKLRPDYLKKNDKNDK